MSRATRTQVIATDSFKQLFAVSDLSVTALYARFATGTPYDACSLIPSSVRCRAPWCTSKSQRRYRAERDLEAPISGRARSADPFASGEVLGHDGDMPRERKPLLLLRRGRVLTPRARMRYRIERLRFVPSTTDGELLDLILYVARAISIPVLALFDWAAWPIVKRTLGRGPWWVVELRWNDEDAEFVRIAQASTRAEAQSRRSALSA